MNTSFTLQERIVHLLLLKSYSYRNPGLLSGKMGISLFFMHYFIQTQQYVFEEYAFDLLDKLSGEINQYTPLGLDSGLAGIGWGIEYMIQNNFAASEGDDFCEAIDKKIMQTDPRRINDLSLETGLEGILHYVLIHLRGAILKNHSLPFDKEYLTDLYTAVCAHPLHTISGSLHQLIKSYREFYQNSKTIHYDPELFVFVQQVAVNDTNLRTLPLGLGNGLAGYMFASLIK